MKLESERAGTLRRSSKGYSFFLPKNLQEIRLNANEKILSSLAKASRLEGEVEANGKVVPDKDLFVSMYVQKEAVLSSQIEGTQATLVDVLQRDFRGETRKDIGEVVNYIKTLKKSKELLKQLPISLRFLKEAHRALLSSVRGYDKQPGEFRKTQNWIGPGGCTLLTASYVPPAPDEMMESLFALEDYIQRQDGVDPLVKAALIHYQFETIHPFLDGNGRLGRILIPIYLYDKGRMDISSVYPSLFLNKNQRKYYRMLEEVRTKGKYEEWVTFFLDGLSWTFQEGLRTMDQLSKLMSEIRSKVFEKLDQRSRKSYENALRFLCSHPYFKASELVKALNVTAPTGKKIVQRLLALGVLSSITPERRRDSVYGFEKYVQIFEDTNVDDEF